MKETLPIGVIISTYNNPEWLEKVLWGYQCQQQPPVEIIIADDGSGDPTRTMIANFAATCPIPIKHIWHEDRGFQKSQILNKAILAAEAPYLIFTDQDCIPRRDFVSTHHRFAQKGYMLSGGYFKLPLSISRAITREEVESQEAFSIQWLRKMGGKVTFKWSKLLNCALFSWIMNHITPANASWNGCNSSGWREDMLSINGYNEQMQYGGQDREFGERLHNLGIRSKQIRYSAICLHLDHGRPYKTPESIAKNRAIRKQTRKSKIIRTPHGIEKTTNS